MGIQCGIVGLPNVGKSTLFNALTQAGIDAENFPFCTIEPNTGVVAVPDPRQGQISALVKPRTDYPCDNGIRGHSGFGCRRLEGRGTGQPVFGQYP